MSFLRKLFGLGAPESSAAGETETVRKIAEALDRLEPERARYIAAFAFLLSRVAFADLSASSEETRAMERVVEERLGLEGAQAVLAVQIAKTQSRLFGGTENFLVTREFERIATREQKLAVLDCLYAVSAAEGGISVVEDNEIARIANELRLDRADLVDARLKFRDQLAVLRKADDA